MSLAIIPLPAGGSITAIRKLRKALRDVRDRAARADTRWGAITMAGFASDGVALILLDHGGMDRAEIWSPLSARWSMTLITEVGDAKPSSWMSVEDAVALGRCRRGVEPRRIIIRPQATLTDFGDEPMPMAF